MNASSQEYTMVMNRGLQEPDKCEGFGFVPDWFAGDRFAPEAGLR